MRLAIDENDDEARAALRPEGKVIARGVLHQPLDLIRVDNGSNGGPQQQGDAIVALTGTFEQHRAQKNAAMWSSSPDQSRGKSDRLSLEPEQIEYGVCVFDAVHSVNRHRPD